MNKELAPGADKNLRGYKYQSVEISVTAAAAANSKADYKASFETDKLYKRVIGVTFEVIPSASGVNTDNLKIGRFDIQNREIYAQDLPVKRMLYDSTVNFNDSFDRMINEEAAGSKVDIILSEYNSGAFVPYKVVVYLWLSNFSEDMPQTPAAK